MSEKEGQKIERQRKMERKGNKDLERCSGDMELGIQDNREGEEREDNCTGRALCVWGS